MTSDDVRRFLLERIESFDQLEALMVVRRDPDRAWTVESLGAAMNAPPDAAAAALDALARRGLLEPATFRFRPQTPELGGLVARLAEEHERDRLAIMRQMSANAVERLRTTYMRAFSDAFLFRKEKGDG